MDYPDALHYDWEGDAEARAEAEAERQRARRAWYDYRNKVQYYDAAKRTALTDEKVNEALAEGKWASADGRVYNVVDMETSHLINTVAFLLRAELREKHDVASGVEGLVRPTSRFRPIFAAMKRELDARLKRKREEDKLREAKAEVTW